MKESVIVGKSFDFALTIIDLYRELVDKHEYVISKQILRSGTSIGANVEEAQAGISKKEFVNKLSIASKEARETRYWLRLLDKSQYIKRDYTKYLEDATELIKMLTAIVKTAQKNM
ncbi:MAG TPA: four helix bundle protein [Cytophagales bacterium]|nr:four helix bundle protein [Cytophagales bacterium]